MNSLTFNGYGVWAIYSFEMARALRTVWQSIVTPVITTALYFVVFGSAIGSRMTEIDGVPYGAFIVPGLIMLSLFTQSIFNASFGIYFPKFTGTIYELLSAPVSPLEIVIAYVGAAATKSIILGLIILATAFLFVPIRIAHPVWMVTFHSASPAGTASRGSCRFRVRVFLPSFFIRAVFSSTRISSPLRITPTRSAISSASSM